MGLTIQGTYKNGTVSLDRLPEGVDEARVAVSFEASSERRRGVLKFGMFAKPDKPFTSDADVEAVKKSLNRPTSV
jgi:hypothetical protein